MKAALSFLIEHCLCDNESYVYLNAIRTIVLLSTLARDVVLEAVLGVFATGSTSAFPTAAAPVMVGTSESSSSGTTSRRGKSAEVSVRVRVLLGEVIGSIIRQAGEMRVIVSPPVITSCITLARVRPTSIPTTTTTTSTTPDPTGMNRVNSDKGSHSILLRQSAMSLLADCVAESTWALTRYLPDIVDIVANALCMEQDQVLRGLSHEANISIRRYVVTVYIYTVYTTCYICRLYRAYVSYVFTESNLL